MKQNAGSLSGHVFAFASLRASFRHVRNCCGVSLVLTALLGAVSAQAATKYVVPGGAGIRDGSSWANAASSIRAAVDTSPSGTEVWVAGGTYTGVSDPVVSVKAGVAVLGGFAGTETSRAQRDWAAHLTTIDGESARQCADVSTSATLDGFTVTRGTATEGGGIYSEGTVANCKVTSSSASGNGGGIRSSGVVMDCVVTENRANLAGGGIYSEAKVTNCTVTGNTVTADDLGYYYGGGGIYSSGSVTDCTVTGNTAVGDYHFGGGIFSTGIVTDCTVTSNSASLGGGGMYTEGTATNCTVTGNSQYSFEYGGGGVLVYGGALTDCTVTGNWAYYGGGIFFNTGRNGTVTNCIVTGNTADCGGGIGGFGAVTNCTVSGNLANILGGGIYRCTVTNCTVTGNSASDRGGGICAGYVVNCTVTGNSANVSGGGIYGSDVTNCTVKGNSANGNGGGICDGAVTNCTVTGNSANGSGGGIANVWGGTVTNCTVTGNAANGSGGGIYNGSGTVTNCIAWLNGSSDVLTTSSSVSFSCYSEAIAGVNGNLSSDPLFISRPGSDPAAWDLHLQSGSPCRGSGIIAGAPATDIEGNPRPGADGVVSMGVYEYTVEPAITSFSINAGATETGDRLVTLDNVCTRNPTDYQASESADFNDASWRTYSSAPTFTLSAGAGTKTVYLKVRNAEGESPVLSDSIMLVLGNPVMASKGLSVRSAHSEVWSAKGGSVASKDTYSVSAKMQLPDSFDLAAVNESISLSVQAGGVLFQNTLGNAAKKKLDNPAMGGSATFTRTETDAKGKTRGTQTVSVRWDKKKSLTITIAGKPLAGDGGVSENIVDLSGATVAAGVVTYDLGVSVAFGGESSGDTILSCSGKKKTKSAPGAAGTQLTGWSVSGKK